MNKKLKLLLLELGIPQYQLAHELGLSETRLSRIVRGRIAPTEKEQELIAARLARPVREIFVAPTARSRSA